MKKILIGGGLSVFAFFALCAMPARAEIIFNSIDNPLLGSYVSLGYQATSTTALGDYIQFGGTDRDLKNVRVILTNWACENDFSKDGDNWIPNRENSAACISTGGSGYNHPITLNIYSVVDDSNADPAVGGLLGSKTIDAFIPFRPSYEDGHSCATPASDIPFGGTWYSEADGKCYHGFNFGVDFNMEDLNLILPDKVIFSVSYNTQSYGDNPIGKNGPYNSLNYGLQTDSPSSGIDLEEDYLFWDTKYPGYTSGLKRDGDWSPYTPAIMFETIEDTTKPTTPTISGFLNPSLSCGAITNIHSTTVDWSDSTDAGSGIKGYEYAINYPLANGSGYGDWKIFLASSQYGGSLNEGIHKIRVRAQDNAGNYSDWSNECAITADWTAPDVEITNPNDGLTVSGIVNVRGSVNDANPHHYWFVIQNSGGTTVAGPRVVNDTNSFNDKLLLSWDTTNIANGTYIIKFEARDAANNKDDGSSDWHEVTVDNDLDKDDDGVEDKNDLCVSIIPPSEGDIDLNPNHYAWTGSIATDKFKMGAIPAKNKNGKAVGPNKSFTLNDTFGCSCLQIIDWLVAEDSEKYGDMLGQREHGCSLGTMEEFIELADAEE